LNDVTVSVANADQSMVRISSIDFTYLIAFVVASGPPYHSRVGDSASAARARARGGTPSRCPNGFNAFLHLSA
jgi:hypothetical protein